MNQSTEVEWTSVVLWGAQPTATFIEDANGRRQVPTSPYLYFVDLIDDEGGVLTMSDRESRGEALADAIELAAELGVPFEDQTACANGQDVVSRTLPKQQSNNYRLKEAKRRFGDGIA